MDKRFTLTFRSLGNGTLEMNSEGNMSPYEIIGLLEYKKAEIITNLKTAEVNQCTCIPSTSVLCDYCRSKEVIE